VLWVQAALHGDEIGGTLALQRFLAEVDLGNLRGAVICVMAANATAFADGRRTAVRDGIDFNRAFPGHAAGDRAQRVARYLMDAMTACTDAVIDLHSGGVLLDCCHHVIVPHADDDRALRLAEALGAPRVWRLREHELSATAVAILARHGIPAVMVESGSARVTDEDVNRYLRAIFGACVHLKQLPGLPGQGHASSARIAAKPADVDTAAGSDSYSIVTAGNGGIFVATADAGAHLEAGADAGRILDVFGACVETIRVPQGWLAARRSSPSVVHAGDTLLEVIHGSASHAGPALSTEGAPT
jgi:predicted deacylase